MQMTHSKSLKVPGRPWHRKIAIIALLGLALLANSSQAQSTDSTASGTLSLSTVLSNQKLMVAEFKSEIGAYDPRLLNLLVELATTQQEIKDYVGANVTLQEALQLTRINDGLYAPNQLAILDSIIANETSLKNWPAVDNHYEFMLHLLLRAYSFEDAELEIGLQKVSSWHVNAFNNDIDDRTLEHLRRGNKVFQYRLQTAEQTLDEDDPKLSFLRRNIATIEEHLERIRSEHVVESDRSAPHPRSGGGGGESTC
jgi:hypothetical protein